MKSDPRPPITPVPALPSDPIADDARRKILILLTFVASVFALLAGTLLNRIWLEP